MAYEIYTVSGSPRGWRVMLGFLVKGIEFEVRTLDASRQELKAPAFLALNPRGRVPVLRHGDFVLPESLAILAYLDREHPNPTLFGTRSREQARIWQLVSAADHYLRDGNDALLGPIFFRSEDDTSAQVQKGASLVREEFKRLDDLLSERPFLAGEGVTAADCVCFPEVRLVLRANERFPAITKNLGLHPFDARYPRLGAWAARIETLPGYEKTFPPHWRTQ